MVAANPNDRVLSLGSNPTPPVNRLAQRLLRYLDQHPEVSREEFLHEAVRREIDRREGQGATRRPTTRTPLTAEDIRIHAWLSDRLEMLHYERYSLWPRLRRFLLGNPLARWLGLQSPRTTHKRKG
jgi:hypothetical protein